MVTIKLNRSEINSTDLSHLQKYVDGHENAVYFNMPAGVEHYRLLAHISTAMPKESTIFDIGTYLGYSATALAINPDVKVVTYDIIDSIPNKEARQSLTNIEYRIGNCLENAEEIAKQTKLIVIDVDPHDGIQEKEMLDAFTKAGFKGMMIFTNINLNEAMRNFWHDINIRGTFKIDATVCGHHTGTGFLVWKDSEFDVIVESI